MRTSMAALATILALAATPAEAQRVPFFAAPTDRGIVLRWVWGDGERPAGYFVERRASSASPWTRLTPRPIARIRDRAAARAILGDAFERYSGLLFPTRPGAERADPETVRGMLLLSADLEPGVAHVLGLRYEDASAVAGTAHEYRLIALTAAGEREAATSGAVIAGGYRPPAGPDAVAALPGSRGAALRWTAQPRFSGYHVYRGARRDGSDARRLNESPVIVFTRDDGTPVDASPTFFTDTAPPRDSAFYRVRGIDMFGRLSEPSLPAPIVWRAPVVMDAPVLLQSRVSGDTVIVSWQPPDGTPPSRYQLWRADSAAGPFQRVGTPVRAPAREQRDPGRPARRVTWYRVTALDDAGHESDPSPLTLAEIPDREPPPPPDSLIAAADTGRMTLRWPQVPARDLRGYRVYRASAPGGTFVLLSPRPRLESRYVDSVPSRADHPFYYRVTAVDSAFNESRPSPVIAVRPPDVTPPSAPDIAGVRRLDGALVLAWSRNPEPDIAGYRARLRARGASAWQELDVVPPSQTSDTVTNIVVGTVYELSVLAIDDAGNASAPARPVTASAARPRALDRPDLRGVAFDARQGGVVVTWATARGSRTMLVLRREPGDPAFRVVGSAGRDTLRFLDRTIRPGRTYEYAVRSRDAFGNESESRARRVETPVAGARP